MKNYFDVTKILGVGVKIIGGPLTPWNSFAGVRREP